MSRVARTRKSDATRDETRLRELDRRRSASGRGGPAGGAPLGHAGRTGGFQANGLVAITEAQLLSGGMSLVGSALVVPRAGNYRCQATSYVTGGVDYTATVELLLNGLSNPSMPSSFRRKSSTEDDKIYFGGLITLAEGDAVSIRTGPTTPSAANTWGTTGFNGTWIELEWAGE